MDNIPENVKHILRNKDLTLQQKMTAFMAFMPNLPQNNSEVYQQNIDLGVEIKKLIDDKKISLGKFDSDFNLDIQQL